MQNICVRYISVHNTCMHGRISLKSYIDHYNQALIYDLKWSHIYWTFINNLEDACWFIKDIGQYIIPDIQQINDKNNLMCRRNHACNACNTCNITLQNPDWRILENCQPTNLYKSYQDINVFGSLLSHCSISIVMWRHVHIIS